jgi:hypothetical protein
LFSFFLDGCGGKIAGTGWGSISGIGPDGRMLFHYADGKTAFKKIDPDASPRKETEMVLKHLGEPGRYVETKKGSTITFGNGDTLHYREVIEDKK